jgi:phosphate transport system protein
MSRTQYFTELESVRQELIEMGETTLSLVDQAVLSLGQPGATSSGKAGDLEARTDHQHRVIRDRCLNLITLQSPVARDARLITGILDAIVDLELIADYSCDIVTLSISTRRRAPLRIIAQVSDVARRVREVLEAAIDYWRGNKPDSPVWLAVASIKEGCNALYGKLSGLISGSGDPGTYADLMMICRQLERILRHALCVADQAASAAGPERSDGGKRPEGGSIHE